MVIADEVEWLDVEQWRAAQGSFASQLEQWRRDWESRDTERYMSHYAREFRGGNGMHRAAWGAHKRRVNATRSWIEVTLSDLSILRSPGKQALVLATFEQRSRKRQHWLVEDGRWKIAYEGAAVGAQLALPRSFPSTSSVNAPRGARSKPAGVRH